MNCCNKQNIKDLSQGLGGKRHWFCMSCRSHNYSGRQWSKVEWEYYVNGLMDGEK